MFYRTSQLQHVVLSAMICLVVLTSGCLSAGEQASTETPKLYSPFDEPKPKMPPEIQADKRLDKKVDVSVKSRNMNDLFSEIRKQTGVRIVVSKELAGERPIIFFHGKPLRDVMTEMSALYGYYWLARGQKDTCTYELFEDRIHAKRRDQVRDIRESAQVDALMEAIDIVTEAGKNPSAMERLRQTNERLYKTATTPAKQGLLSVINLLGKDTVRGCLNDVGTSWNFPEMSQELQSAILDTINSHAGPDNPEFIPYVPEEMQKSFVRVKRWRQSIFTPPHVVLVVTMPGRDGKPGWRSFDEWPGYTDGEPDMLNLPEQPAARVIGDPLPDAKISIETKHEVFNYGAILLQDVLQAIASQAKLNVIADYYYQPEEFPACDDEPLEKLVADLCRKMGYSCQVDGNTLRFRFNKWYLQPLQEEPTARFQEVLWKRITDAGALTLDDLLDIACLPGQQTYWGGFRFIPMAQQARLFPRTARLVRMLGSSLEAQARTPEGLSVSKLDSEQLSRIVDWVQIMGIKLTDDGLLESKILIERSGTPETNLTFTLVTPDGNSRNVALSGRLDPFDEKDRKTLVAERAAELAADRVELSPVEK